MKKYASIFPLLLFFIISLSACANLNPPEFQGAVYSTPAPPPNFSFPSTTGEEFNLAEHQGKVVLLFFGYTFCPDICPATLGVLKSALNQLTPEERANVEVVFVTIDPERDTLDQLGRYLDAFEAGFIGAVPTLEQLQSLKEGYALVAEKEAVQPDGSYLMAHTGLVYVLDKEGNLRLGFFDGTTADSIAHDLEILLSE